MSINLYKDDKIYHTGLFQTYLDKEKEDFTKKLFNGEKINNYHLIYSENVYLKKDLQEQTNKVLEDLRETILKQEQQFYKDIGVVDFSGFVQKWKQTDNLNKNEIFFDETLSFFTGSNQKRAILSSTGRSITKILQNLISISIDGSSSLIKKSDIYAILQQKGLIKKTEWGYYVPPENKTINDIVKDINEIIEEELSIKTYKKLQEYIVENETSSDVLRALKETFFVTISFGNIKKMDTYEKRLLEILLQYIQKSITKEKKDGLQDEQWIFIEKQYKILINDFLKTNYEITKGDKLTSDTLIQGFFGEMYTQGKLLFKIKPGIKQKFEIYNTGKLYGKDTKQQLSYDTLIVTENGRYGIQTKNPYELYEGTYTTYSESLSANSSALFTRYLTDSIGKTNQDIKDTFQLLVINEKQDKTGQITQQVINLLYMFSNNFIRIFSEEIREKQAKNFQGKIRKDLLSGAAYNIFFVVKGELIPSSLILNQIIVQYNNSIKPQENKDYTFYYNIKNDNKINENNLIIESKQLAQLLEKIKIITKLKTPPHFI